MSNNYYGVDILKPEGCVPNKISPEEYVESHNVLQMYIYSLWKQLPIVAKTNDKSLFDLDNNWIEIHTYALDLPIEFDSYGFDNTTAKLGLINIFFEQLQRQIPPLYVVIERRSPELQLISKDIVKNTEEWRLSCRLGVTDKPFIINGIRYNGQTT